MEISNVTLFVCAFVVGCVLYFREARVPQLPVTVLSCTHKNGYFAKNPEENYEASCSDILPNREDFLSHSSNEIQRHTSLLSKPCRCFDSFVFTNCYKLPNLASFYMGGSIVSTRDTIPFVPPCSKCGQYGCTNDVNTIIKPEIVLPGKNWRFVGQRGRVLIQLPVMSLITAITIIHLPKSELPEGFFSSAPKEFCIYGLTQAQDKSPVYLGSHKYSAYDLPAQTFRTEIQPGDSNTMGHPIFQFIEVIFRKNHGNPRYTAIYKIEVHGIPLIRHE